MKLELIEGGTDEDLGYADQIFEYCDQVEEVNPLKQGLKPVDIPAKFDKIIVEEVNPLKQGLKPIRLSTA